MRCLFITDKKDVNTELGSKLESERFIYQDIEFQPLSGGVLQKTLGGRLLYHMLWAVQNYDFDYFLRIDDDYFICLDRLLLEIPMPPRGMYHWGFVHCHPGLVRPDESIIMLSKDLIEIFLGQDPNIMKCLPIGDEMIGQWKADLNIGPIYHAESRLHHHPPASKFDYLLSLKNVCQTYLGLHGSYPIEMLTFWKNRGKPAYPNTTFESYYEKCELGQYLDWTLLPEEFQFEPKRCILNPKWSIERMTNEHGEYKGREDSISKELDKKRFERKWLGYQGRLSGTSDQQTQHKRYDRKRKTLRKKQYKKSSHERLIKPVVPGRNNLKNKEAHKRSKDWTREKGDEKEDKKLKRYNSNRRYADQYDTLARKEYWAEELDNKRYNRRQRKRVRHVYD